MHRIFFVVAALFVMSAGSPAQTPQWFPRAVTTPAGTTIRWMAYDSARGETVAWNSAGRQTWVFGGVDWTLRASNSGPSGTHADWCQACYDSHRQRLVALCGNQSVGLQTWEWDGTSWAMITAAGMSGRHTFSMAFDAVSNRTLVFGGKTGDESGFAELWAWDGVSWVQIANGGPTPRWGAAMEWDATRQVMLLFGGRGPVYGQAQMLGDTWEWNGIYWFNHFGIAGPSARAYAAAAFDPLRDRMILYGGQTQSSVRDTWEWDGGAWSGVQPQGSPTNLIGMCFDAARGVPVLLTQGTPNLHWEYLAGAVTQATWATFGAGCAGPAGTPSLDALPGSLPSIGTTLQLELTNLPASPLNLAFGIVGFDAASWNGQPLPLSLASFGMPGCSAWIAPTYTVTLANSSGVAAWNVVIPMSLYFVGVDVYTQGAVLVPGWNPASVVVSNAGQAGVGTP